MDTHVPGQARQGPGGVANECWHFPLSPRPRLRTARRVSQRPRRVTHRRTWSIGDDVSDLCRAVAPVEVIDVPDNLLTPTGLDIDIDVGRPRARVRQEALEKEVVAHRVHRRDAQAKAHSRVCGTAPPLTQDAALATKIDDFLHDQEVPLESEALDNA